MFSAYSLDPLSARGPRLEGIAEVLGLTGNLPVSELHDTHRVRRQAVVCKDEFSDPKVDSTHSRTTENPGSKATSHARGCCSQVFDERPVHVVQGMLLRRTDR